MPFSPTLALLGGLLVLSGFLSASETALFSLNRIQVRRLSNSRRRRDRAVVSLLDRPSEVLSAILVANTLVNVAVSALITAAFLELPGIAAGRATVIASLLGTGLIILVAEITPKTIAIRHAEPIARFAARPLKAVLAILRPLVVLLSGVANVFLRLFGIRTLIGGAGSLTPGELRLLIEEVQEETVLSQAEREIAGRIFDFSATRAAEVMTPRVDIRSADRRVSSEALAEVIRSSSHARIPISDGSLDQIVGFVSAKEYLLNPGASLDQLLKPVLFVPETKRVNEIFHEIQRRRIGMVVVVDEYGHTVGIITKEDLIEEIVGEIYDEYDTDRAPIVKIGPDRYLVSGRMGVAELAKQLGADLDRTERVTLNGLLADLLGRIPRTGDRVEHGGLSIRVLEVRRHRVHRSEVRKLHPMGVGSGRPGASGGELA
jgi:CBS domain containing-hemolysin-like protein